ncbi:rCG20061 [Rattus norvegicus]|uniref:RCG20061 n=1 Tax=Rattus norvegicus TaxID=10116 RepID=A6JG65_RAT|nr:rCG20061 [Rattus norvegicus]
METTNSKETPGSKQHDIYRDAHPNRNLWTPLSRAGTDSVPHF